MAVSVPLIALAGITWIALEAGDVLVVETINNDDNSVRTTHIWFVQDEKVLYLKAGNPENPWVQDLPNTPGLRLTGSGVNGTYSYELAAGPESHKRIRRLMRGEIRKSAVRMTSGSVMSARNRF
jgi:hypothetical protein